MKLASLAGMHAGRSWAYGGVAFGAVASVAANIAHAYAKTTTPEFGAVVAAAFWPLALLVTIEVLLRITWSTGRLVWWVRYGGVGVVAGVAAIVSYQHLNGLLRHYGESALTARTGPLAIDGLMLVCSAALLQKVSSAEATGATTKVEATSTNRSAATRPSTPIVDPARVAGPPSPALAGSTQAPPAATLDKPVELAPSEVADLRVRRAAALRQPRPKVEAKADARVAGTDAEKVAAVVAAVNEGRIDLPLSVAAVGKVVVAGGDKRKQIRDEATALLGRSEASGDAP